MDETVQIPVWRCGEIVAYTTVDRAAATTIPEVLDWRWRLSTKGYVFKDVGTADKGRETVYLHRLILGLTRGDGLEGDHRNRDPLDNRSDNLGIVSHAENMQNRRANRGSKSPYRGVYHRGPKYKSRPWIAFMRYGDVELRTSLAYERNAARVARAWRMEFLPFSVELDDLTESAGAAKSKVTDVGRGVDL